MCSPYVTLAAAEAQRLKLRAGDSVALSGASKGSAASHGSATVRIEEGEERVPEGVAVVYGGTASAVGDDDGLDLFALGGGVKLKRVAAAGADPAAGADVNAHAQSAKEPQ